MHPGKGRFRGYPGKEPVATRLDPFDKLRLSRRCQPRHGSIVLHGSPAVATCAGDRPSRIASLVRTRIAPRPAPIVSFMALFYDPSSGTAN